MGKYINKDRIVAEIESRITAYQKNFDKTDNKMTRLSADGLIQGLESFLAFLDTLEVKEVEEKPVSELLNIESMIESYKQRLISQANGMKESPLIDMCLCSYKHGINEILDTLKVREVDLRKEMDNYLPTVFSKDMDGGEPRFITWFKALRKTAIHFANWQKEQMTNAIDVEVKKLIHDNNLCGFEASSVNDLVAELKCDNLQLKAELRALQKKCDDLERNK